MLATIGSAALLGIDAVPVSVEVNTGESGVPDLVLVGLPDSAVKESEDRVVSALSNSALRRPGTRTTINLAPGDLRKEGAIYDLPIALGILVATAQLVCDNLGDYLIAGELSLSGATRPIKGGLAMAVLARETRRKAVLLPPVAAQEAALVEGLRVYEITSLDQATRFLAGQLKLTPLAPPRSVTRPPAGNDQEPDFADIKGQHAVRRAVEVAVAGGHNLIMIGPPGSGKSMIAKRIPGIMPQPTLDEYLDILRIHSAAGQTMADGLHFLQRPARAPHHTISDVGLLGGGTIPGPGEISLAHHGVLFLDELPEFKRSALEVLAVRERIEQARQLQLVRFRGTKLTANARMPVSQLKKFCALDAALGDLLQHAMEQLALSARAYDRILKVARTIADLSGAEKIGQPHLLEAIQYRSLDRNVFY